MNTFGTEDNFSLVGRFIRKKFDDEKYHYGLVAKLDPLDNQIYQIVYDNNTWENENRPDLFPQICWSLDKIPKKKMEKCYHFQRGHEGQLRLEKYKVTDHGLGGLQRASELADLPGIYHNVDSGNERCDYSLCYRFVKKDFNGFPYYGFIVAYAVPFYEVVYEDNDVEDLIKHDAIHLVQDAHVPRDKAILCMQRALQHMQFPQANIQQQQDPNGNNGLGLNSSSSKLPPVSDDEFAIPSDDDDDEEEDNDDDVEDDRSKDVKSVSSDDEERANKKAKVDSRDVIIID